ncbi:hypothetical protein [Streptomyces noursei]|uniref:DNA-binding protein n=1 Tax=Streptomyces noursei TaxID=1971 RepID=A0A401R1T1_STRNR|nr:hypothetical protein [Streptomyces noursei]EOT03682.1 hypothetical protein K530_12362 [Streptomyces noursei CCRC 11814]EXU85830.1 hypothetical protein P354_06275 [Streptomyces noursei PD-1]MCZ0974011.1 hypothetical protein [Streptomyces noursei]UWS72622.1 hypothetical protein N1H47_16000 [Streptomyces noursei]GCB91570.1 hypothetical protein SALB_04305 [Streptomyces noursei]
MRADESGLEVAQKQGAWVIRMWWPTGPITGGPQRVTIEQADDASARDVARGISTTVLRRLDLPGAVKSAEELAPTGQEVLTDVSKALSQGCETARVLLENEGVSETYLAMLAFIYKGMADSGAVAPVRWLAERIGRSTETIKSHLKQARRDGFLTTIAGKAGGELTDKANTVLSRITAEPDA